MICHAALGAEPVAVATVPAGMGRQPQLAIGGDGAVHLVFGNENSIFYCGSTDAATTFSQPVEVARCKALSLGMRRGPRIAAGHRALVVSAIAGDVGKGRDGDLLAWRSSDGGRSWQGPVRVNEVSGSAREGLHAMAVSSGGDLYCAWLDLRNGKTEIFGARSSDDGATWTTNRRIYRSPSGSVCECCHPSVAFDPSGRLYVMWRNSVDGARDMYVAISTDGGMTFGSAQKLGWGTWPLEACPMDGGMIAPLASGLASVWRRERQIYLATQGQPEQRVGSGEQPWAAATPRGAVLAWLEKRPGNLLVLPPGGKPPRKIAENARDPVIAARSDTPGPVVIAWEGLRDGHPAVWVQTLAPQ
jgi:hypothetical protein